MKALRFTAVPGAAAENPCWRNPADGNLTPSSVLTVDVPGSKSYTIRALMLAALTPGPVRLVNPLHSDDTTAMIHCLRTLGIEIEEITGGGQNAVIVTGSIADIAAESEATLNTDLSAASIRFLIALCAVVPGTQTLLGKAGLNKRPVRDLVESLRSLGVAIDYLERDGYPPVRVHPVPVDLLNGSIRNRNVQVSGQTSSQFVSALMMIAPVVGGLKLELIGKTTSIPYLGMTQSIMSAFGVHADYVAGEHLIREIEADASLISGRWLIASENGYSRTPEYIVEGDASSACYAAALAVITHSTVVLNNLPGTSCQADMEFLEFLATRMGATLDRDSNPNAVTITGRGIRPLAEGLPLNMENCPDQAQTMAVLLAFANGTSRIEGLKSLRVKETDRLSAVATELKKMGVSVIEEADAITIHGGNACPASIATYGDHRMAFAFALAGVKLPGLVIEDPAVVSKTYPHFWEDWHKLGVSFENADSPQVIANAPFSRVVLTGFMGAGKTMIAALLAERTGWHLLELDTLIVAASGRESITEIFEQDGEARFRALEVQIAESLRTRTNVIVSTGGGFALNTPAMTALSQSAAVVYLRAPLSAHLQRLTGDTARPLLKQPESAIEALYTQRVPVYAQQATHAVDTTEAHPLRIEEICDRSPEAIVGDILAQCFAPAPGIKQVAFAPVKLLSDLSMETSPL